jgi:hypothetical protein
MANALLADRRGVPHQQVMAMTIELCRSFTRGEIYLGSRDPFRVFRRPLPTARATRAQDLRLQATAARDRSPSRSPDDGGQGAIDEIRVAPR